MMKKVKNLILLLSLIGLVGCSNLDVQMLNQKAAEYMKNGDVDGAIARLESINDLNPNFPQTYYNLGIAYHKKGEYEKSITALNKAIELKPEFSEAYYTRAIVYEDMATSSLENKTKDGQEQPNATKISSEQKQKAVEYFTKAKDDFEKYLESSKDTNDKEDITTKIKQLDEDIQKYSSEDNKQSSETESQ